MLRDDERQHWYEGSVAGSSRSASGRCTSAPAPRPPPRWGSAPRSAAAPRPAPRPAAGPAPTPAPPRRRWAAGGGGAWAGSASTRSAAAGAARAWARRWRTPGSSSSARRSWAARTREAARWARQAGRKPKMSLPRSPTWTHRAHRPRPDLRLARPGLAVGAALRPGVRWRHRLAHERLLVGQPQGLAGLGHHRQHALHQEPAATPVADRAEAARGGVVRVVQRGGVRHQQDQRLLAGGLPGLLPVRGQQRRVAERRGVEQAIGRLERGRIAQLRGQRGVGLARQGGGQGHHPAGAPPVAEADRAEGLGGPALGGAGRGGRHGRSLLAADSGSAPQLTSRRPATVMRCGQTSGIGGPGEPGGAPRAGDSTARPIMQPMQSAAIARQGLSQPDLQSPPSGCPLLSLWPVAPAHPSVLWCAQRTVPGPRSWRKGGAHHASTASRQCWAAHLHRGGPPALSAPRHPAQRGRAPATSLGSPRRFGSPARHACPVGYPHRRLY